MHNPALRAADVAESHRIAIRALAERSHYPLELVEKVYLGELIELERGGARITKYLSLVTSRRARERLQR